MIINEARAVSKLVHEHELLYPLREDIKRAGNSPIGFYVTFRDGKKRMIGGGERGDAIASELLKSLSKIIEVEESRITDCLKRYLKD